MLAPTMMTKKMQIKNDSCFSFVCKVFIYFIKGLTVRLNYFRTTLVY